MASGGRYSRIALAAVLLLLLGIGMGTAAQTARAHLNTYGYSDIAISDEGVSYDLYMDAREVSQWMDLRSGGVFVLEPGQTSGAASAAEVIWSEEELQPLLDEGLTVSVDGQALSYSISGMSIEERGGVPYLNIKLDYAVPAGADAYAIHYGLFFNEDPGHQNFATIRSGEASQDYIFTKDRNEALGKLDFSQADSGVTITLPAWLVTIREYVMLGIEHILTGTDHLLFIAALVLVRQSKWSDIKVLTSFTAGHSLTIALAALDIINLPAAVVEPVIALSIAYVAVENIWAKQVRRRWAVALGFGLIHGFGFAQVLRGALSDHYLLTLFSFNLGVELGQLAVLAVMLPLLIWASRYRSYRMVNYAASGLIAAAGCYWFVTRLLSLL